MEDERFDEPQGHVDYPKQLNEATLLRLHGWDVWWEENWLDKEWRLFVETPAGLEERISAIKFGNHYDPNKYGVIHRSTYPGVTWQLSRFDEHGPWGHSDHDTLDDAIREGRTYHSYFVDEIVERNPHLPIWLQKQPQVVKGQADTYASTDGRVEIVNTRRVVIRDPGGGRRRVRMWQLTLDRVDQGEYESIEEAFEALLATTGYEPPSLGKKRTRAKMKPRKKRPVAAPVKAPTKGRSSRPQQPSKPLRPASPHSEQAVLALTSMGWKRKQAEAAVASIAKAKPRLELPELTREAMTELAANKVKLSPPPEKPKPPPEPEVKLVRVPMAFYGQEEKMGFEIPAAVRRTGRSVFIDLDDQFTANLLNRARARGTQAARKTATAIEDGYRELGRVPPAELATQKAPKPPNRLARIVGGESPVKDRAHPFWSEVEDPGVARGPASEAYRIHVGRDAPDWGHGNAKRPSFGRVLRADGFQFEVEPDTGPNMPWGDGSPWRVRIHPPPWHGTYKLISEKGWASTEEPYFTHDEAVAALRKMVMTPWTLLPGGTPESALELAKAEHPDASLEDNRALADRVVRGNRPETDADATDGSTKPSQKTKELFRSMLAAEQLRAYALHPATTPGERARVEQELRDLLTNRDRELAKGSAALDNEWPYHVAQLRFSEWKRGMRDAPAEDEDNALAKHVTRKVLGLKTNDRTKFEAGGYTYYASPATTLGDRWRALNRVEDPMQWVIVDNESTVIGIITLPDYPERPWEMRQVPKGQKFVGAVTKAQPVRTSILSNMDPRVLVATESARMAGVPVRSTKKKKAPQRVTKKKAKPPVSNPQQRRKERLRDPEAGRQGMTTAQLLRKMGL